VFEPNDLLRTGLALALQHAITHFMAHYHAERNHQGLANNSCGSPYRRTISVVHRRQRLGGMLNYYRRSCVNCVDSVSDSTTIEWEVETLSFYSVPLRVRLRHAKVALRDQQAAVARHR